MNSAIVEIARLAIFCILRKTYLVSHFIKDYYSVLVQNVASLAFAVVLLWLLRRFLENYCSLNVDMTWAIDSTHLFEKLCKSGIDHPLLGLTYISSIEIENIPEPMCYINWFSIKEPLHFH